jgi:hypothetical protein
VHTNNSAKALVPWCAEYFVDEDCSEVLLYEQLLILRMVHA